jgi:hypothetical protein
MEVKLKGTNSAAFVFIITVVGKHINVAQQCFSSQNGLDLRSRSRPVLLYVEPGCNLTEKGRNMYLEKPTDN